MCVFQRIDGRNSIRVAIMIGGGDMKSPVNWMSVTHRALIEEVDKSLRQVFRHTLDVCVCPLCAILTASLKNSERGQITRASLFYCTRAIEC